MLETLALHSPYPRRSLKKEKLKRRQERKAKKRDNARLKLEDAAEKILREEQDLGECDTVMIYPP